ncbi:MAG: thiol:disulfide interchange protein DsbA/DsbL, partial [Gammaproteobacteria bacterium]|nr:thiol:disulfide interchange protein DsbA/DsbL [Gammaproteobacteria bacterium]
VLDVFSYACPHCFTFLPLIEAYEQVAPDYVEVRHMPAVFNERWAILARAYYAAKALGVDQQIHRPLFEAIHVKNRKLDTEDDFMKFFAEFGVSSEDFKNTWSSFAVESAVRKSTVMQQRYGIRGTPSIVVNGKYRVTGQLAGSYDNMIQITDALAARENAESN